MTCARCFKELEDGSAFCRFCGAAVGAAPSVPRITRIPAEGQVGGVCAGLAAYFDADVTLIRLAWVILSIVPGLLLGGVLVYAVCWILLPVATLDERRAVPRTTTDAIGRRSPDRRRLRWAGGVSRPRLHHRPHPQCGAGDLPRRVHRRGDRLSDRMDGHPRESGAVACREPIREAPNPFRNERARVAAVHSARMSSPQHRHVRDVLGTAQQVCEAGARHLLKSFWNRPRLMRAQPASGRGWSRGDAGR